VAGRHLTNELSPAFEGLSGIRQGEFREMMKSKSSSWLVLAIDLIVPSAQNFKV
jgi:hypothetical protein